VVILQYKQGLNLVALSLVGSVPGHCRIQS